MLNINTNTYKTVNYNDAIKNLDANDKDFVVDYAVLLLLRNVVDIFLDTTIVEHHLDYVSDIFDTRKYRIHSSRHR